MIRPLALVCLTLMATACVQLSAAETNDSSALDLTTSATVATTPTSPASTEAGQLPTSEPITGAFTGVTLPSDGLQAHEMVGFTITYPANASLEDIEPFRVRILGPSFPFQNVPDGSPSYDLTVEVHDNPDGHSADAWARKRILDAWHAATAADQPPGGLPVTDGTIDEDKVRDTQVAGRPAVRIEFLAFDSYVWHYYLDLGDRIVEIQHPVNIEGNVPYAKLQDDVHRLLLGALRFDGPGGASVDPSSAAQPDETGQGASELVRSCDQQMGFCTSHPASWIFRSWEDASEEVSGASIMSTEMPSPIGLHEDIWIDIDVQDADAGESFEDWIASFDEIPIGLETDKIDHLTIDGRPAISRVEDAMQVVDTHQSYSEAVYIDDGQRRWRILALTHGPEFLDRHRQGFESVLQHFEIQGPEDEVAGATGRYFGYFTGIDIDPNGERFLDFDLAHFLGGEAAGRAAVEDGAVDAPNHLSNDFYIRNRYPTTSRYQLPVKSRVKLLGHDDTGVIELQRSKVVTLWSILDGSGPEDRLWMSEAPYWIVVEDGQVRQITMQYLP